MLRVGLTGGIGSGKSRVCELFLELGAPIIDTDEIAHTLVSPGSPTLPLIAQLFGKGVLNEDGTLNRPLMRELVFNDENRRQQLESLLHPLIREEMQRQLLLLDASYVILAIPLLVEKGWQAYLDRVLVVDCTLEQQRQRAAQRDGSSPSLIEHIINSQVSREERLAAAEDIIDNSGSLNALRPQVERLHHYYQSLAANN